MLKRLRREAEILGVSYNEMHPDAVKAIDAINTWYGRGDLPIGTYGKELAAPDNSGYLNNIATASQVDAAPTLRSPDMYKTILARKDVNKGTKVSDLNDLTLVNLTDFSFLGNRLNLGDRGIS